MRPVKTNRSDRFGLIHPAMEAHTLGINSVQQLLEQCGIAAVIADARVCSAVDHLHEPRSIAEIEQWLRTNRITMLGFSYRLDPDQGADLFANWVYQLKNKRLLSDQGGPLRGIYFAGLPRACELVLKLVPEISGVFAGDETPSETLAILGIETTWAPVEISGGIAYDEARLAFGRELVCKGDYLAIKPVDRSGYESIGTNLDTLVARMNHSRQRKLPPLIRAHVGPYLPDRDEAVRLFLDWARRLAASGYLDVLSIGTSQLTQSNFGDDWGGRPNGGGVPINSPEEYRQVWSASRPMLVRTYAGARNVPALARIHEDSLNIAWHALSLWWFCRLDGRGPNSLRENLVEHIEALRYIASTEKPFEPNVPHHFAFRGADDVTYIVSAFLAAKLAKKLGIRHLILQNMLNTPRYVWGVQDLAKSRAMLRLIRKLEDDHFTVILQPRGGLDYFSHDPEKAKAQLAAVTALMDDIEPHDVFSPPIIHVVSYSEGFRLADPPVIDESIKITRHALAEYRRLRQKGEVDDMTDHREVRLRMEDLLEQAQTVIAAIESNFPDPYSADGLYRIFAEGFLPVPYLWECRQEFIKAIQWRTKALGGAIRIVDETGAVISAAERVRFLLDQARAGSA
ncbi:MAG: cobalamin-binding protein [Deltaproteobacteria bacterium HGW-Deltaproteobacteria-12]|jgi:hypothetical protein|nr:MAG: cobalamin-binding protein [Deltaproteobacteria bacterium HGW-Deltaproteobacteria-12]